jgi:NAD(P)-dependent dehydrogenase (short-subunit alcohol dehydrogenase family)
MSALAADALAGIAATPGADGGETGAAEALVDGLIALGVTLVTDNGPVDLAIVAIGGDGRPDLAGAEPSAAASLGARGDGALDAAADGILAAALTKAFGSAREAFARLRPGGCLLFVLADASPEHADADPARAAIGSLTRTLALEWAPDRRVNALICARPGDAVEAAALIAWPASRTLTGAVLDLVDECARLRRGS